MRPKSGLPKRKALRASPRYEHGFRSNPDAKTYRHPSVGESDRKATAEPFEVVSLFCGCGGLDLGMLGGFRYLGDEFAPLPFRVRAAFDNDRNALETYRLNLGDHAELRDLVQTDIGSLPKAEVMIGGFPCQDFSSCGPKQGFDGTRPALPRVVRIHANSPARPRRRRERAAPRADEGRRSPPRDRRRLRGPGVPRQDVAPVRPGLRTAATPPARSSSASATTSTTVQLPPSRRSSCGTGRSKRPSTI